MVVHTAEDQGIWVPALSRDLVLCSWSRQFTVLVPLFTQVYKWVPVNLMLGLTPQQIRIPSRVSRYIPTRFMLRENWVGTFR